MIENLNNNNFLIYAMKSYQSSCMDINEFHEELKRIKYIKRLFHRYKNEGILRERLILNHLIIFYNSFEIGAATRILFYKIPEAFWNILVTFLVFLNYCPDYIDGVRDNRIYVSDIGLDLNLIDILRKI